MNDDEWDNEIKRIKNLKLNMTDTIKELVKSYQLHWKVDAYHINCGLCESFADDLMSIFPNTNAYWDDELDDTMKEGEIGSHYFIKHEGKYYDSESPEGVDDWRNLPLFINNRKNKLDLIGIISDED